MTLAWAGNWSGYLAEIGLQMASWLHCLLQKRSNRKLQWLGWKKSNTYLPNHVMLTGSRYTVAPKSKLTDKTLLRWVQWKISLTYYLSSWIIASVWCYVWKRLYLLNCISRPSPIGFLMAQSQLIRLCWGEWVQWKIMTSSSTDYISSWYISDEGREGADPIQVDICPHFTCFSNHTTRASETAIYSSTFIKLTSALIPIPLLTTLKPPLSMAHEVHQDYPRSSIDPCPHTLIQPTPTTLYRTCWHWSPYFFMAAFV